MQSLQCPDLTYSQYAYDCRRQFVAGDPDIFKLQRRYILIVCHVADYLRVGRAPIIEAGWIRNVGAQLCEIPNHPHADSIGALITQTSGYGFGACAHGLSDGTVPIRVHYARGPHDRNGQGDVAGVIKYGRGEGDDTKCRMIDAARQLARSRFLDQLFDNGSVERMRDIGPESFPVVCQRFVDERAAKRRRRRGPLRYRRATLPCQCGCSYGPGKPSLDATAQAWLCETIGGVLAAV
jgi:hypothetical protein